jgi:hypothetical protein
MWQKEKGGSKITPLGIQWKNIAPTVHFRILGE